MTSLPLDFFEKRACDHQALEDSFVSWCRQNGKVQLSEWLAEHNAERQDLYLAGLIDYHAPSLMPVSLEFLNEPYITPAGTYVICPYEQSDGRADPTLCYVLDSDFLFELIAPYLSRSPVQRRQDYIAEYTAKHGYPPRKDDRILATRYKGVIEE